VASPELLSNCAPGILGLQMFQQVVLKELNGTKLGLFAPGILAH
jgi:hypothetical protein